MKNCLSLSGGFNWKIVYMYEYVKYADDDDVRYR